MRLITERDRIKGVLLDWNYQYPIGRTAPDKEIIRKKLQNLDLNTATARQVNTIIGNNTWIRQHCHECDKPVKDIIQLGEKESWESRTAEMCVPCMTKAFKILTKANLLKGVANA